ncbi:hypothetical protein FJ936_23000 [Mesorhizobium sp. B2-4-13]|nr:hypothetical protein FJ936_23000 [Mesorhizobium sp. B2-4-13]
MSAPDAGSPLPCEQAASDVNARQPQISAQGKNITGTSEVSAWSGYWPVHSESRRNTPKIKLFRDWVPDG